METAASDEDGAAQTEAASVGSEADADRKRKRAEAAKANRAAKAVADGRLPGQRGRPRTVAGSTAAAAQLMPPPPPNMLLPMGTAEAQAYIDDARCRLRELRLAYELAEWLQTNAEAIQYDSALEVHRLDLRNAINGCHVGQLSASGGAAGSDTVIG